MDNSRRFIPSSPIISGDNSDEPIPRNLSHQHILTTPNSSNAHLYDPYIPQSFMQPLTFDTMQPTPVIHEGPRYWINSDGYIVNNTDVGLGNGTQTFKEKPIILEILSGVDIIRGVIRFAQRYDLSVNVLSGNGYISQVDFMFPYSTNPPMQISGYFHIITFSGTYKRSSAVTDEIESNFTVSLVDTRGNNMGGLIASSMKAANNVTVAVFATKELY